MTKASSATTWLKWTWWRKRTAHNQRVTFIIIWPTITLYHIFRSQANHLWYLKITTHTEGLYLKGGFTETTRWSVLAKKSCIKSKEINRLSPLSTGLEQRQPIMKKWWWMAAPVVHQRMEKSLNRRRITEWAILACSEASVNRVYVESAWVKKKRTTRLFAHASVQAAWVKYM